MLSQKEAYERTTGEATSRTFDGCLFHSFSIYAQLCTVYQMHGWERWRYEGIVEEDRFAPQSKALLKVAIWQLGSKRAWQAQMALVGRRLFYIYPKSYGVPQYLKL